MPFLGELYLTILPPDFAKGQSSDKIFKSSNWSSRIFKFQPIEIIGYYYIFGNQPDQNTLANAIKRYFCAGPLEFFGLNAHKSGGFWDFILVQSACLGAFRA